MENRKINKETKEKIDRWITEFSARCNFIEDKNLFEALYECICMRIDPGVLKYYLQNNVNKFMKGTNTDALINHAIDCYYAMCYLMYRQSDMTDWNILHNGY